MFNLQKTLHSPISTLCHHCKTVFVSSIYFYIVIMIITMSIIFDIYMKSFIYTYTPQVHDVMYFSLYLGYIDLLTIISTFILHIIFFLKFCLHCSIDDTYQSNAPSFVLSRLCWIAQYLLNPIPVVLPLPVEDLLEI